MSGGGMGAAGKPQNAQFRLRPEMRAVGGPETAQKKLKRMLGKDDGDGDGGGDGGGRCLPLPRREGRMAARPGQ